MGNELSFNFLGDDLDLGGDQFDLLVAEVITMFPELADDDGPKKRKRFRRPKVDLWVGEWGRLLENPATAVKGSFEYKKFRLRFRVPFPLFCACVNYIVW